MKLLFSSFSFLPIVLISFQLELSAQAIDTTMLCRGNHFTEAEGKASLEKFASSYNDLEGWKKRVARIRKGILEGLGITNLNVNTPLKPITRNKRVHDGYTVENVA